jgi:hypothetical protein
MRCVSATTFAASSSAARCAWPASPSVTPSLTRFVDGTGCTSSTSSTNDCGVTPSRSSPVSFRVSLTIDRLARSAFALAGVSTTAVGAPGGVSASVATD